MYVKIGTTEYAEIKNLSFAPEADIIGSEVPINRFVVDIITTDTITAGGDIYLYDDRDQLWAKFWLTDANRLDANTVNVTGQSLLTLLERITLYPTMYSSTPIATVLSDIFAKVSAIYGQTVIYELDPSFASATISGYLAEHSAKYRLQLVLMVIGAYCKQVFTDHLMFLPVSDTPTFIPLNTVKWKPEIGVSDYVTAVKVRTYSYTAGTPSSTDEWVQVGSTYYIETTQDFTLTNSSVPATAPENIVTIDDVTIINQDNVSDILSRLSIYYFTRGEVSGEVINNASYTPGQLVTLPVNETTAYQGYIRSAEFLFGLQSVSRIKLSQTVNVDLAALVVVCMYGTTELRRNTYHFPAGYEYTIQNLYIETWSVKYHNVYFPQTAEITGTMTAQGVTVTVNYGIALSQYMDMQTVTIYSVDEVTQSTETQDETTIEVLTIS